MSEIEVYNSGTHDASVNFLMRTNLRHSSRLSRLVWASKLVLVSLALVPMLATPPVHGAAPSVEPSNQSAQAPQQVLRDLVKTEVAERWRLEGQRIVERANRALEMATVILDMMRTWVVVLSLMFVIFLAIGLRELGLLRSTSAEATAASSEARRAATTSQEYAAQVAVSTHAAKDAADTASGLAARAKAAEEEIAASAQRIRETDRATLQAIEDLRDYVSTLPKIEKLATLSEMSELPKEIDKFEEADTIIVIAERTRAIEPQKLTDSYIALGEYWRLVDNYPRSVARFRRAIALKPESGEAHLGLCFTLYLYSIQSNIGPALKRRLLDEAERECQEAIKILGKNPRNLFALGWIYDERGDFGRAVEFYLEARELDIEKKVPNITYNLACTYSKAGKLAEALTELEKVIHLDRNWEVALTDTDFENLRAHPEFGRRLQDLIDKAKRKSEG